MNFHQLSVHVQDHLSVSGASRIFSVKYWCYNGNFIHFQCVDETFLRRGSGPFYQLPVWRRYFGAAVALFITFWDDSGTFSALTGSYETFRQLLVRQWQLLSTSGASTGLSVHFQCSVGSFQQLLVQRWYLPSTSGASTRPCSNFW